MNEIEIRHISIELREDASRQSPGRLVGTVLTFGEEARDRREVFEPGSLKWPSEGVILNRQHVRGSPIMRIVPEVRGSQIVVDSPLPDTVAGRDTAQEIRNGLFKGLSVEFRAVKQTYRAGLRHIQEAILAGVGLVDQPSYAGSLAEVRSKKRPKRWL